MPHVENKSPILPATPPDNAPLIDWALWCAEVGRISGAWKVFPCVPGEKRPLRKGWQTEASSDRKTVETMWLNDPQANIGMAIQPGFLAIDCDLYKPGAGAALDAFEAHGELPRTFESNTPRGGIHLIYSTTKTFGNGTGSLPDFGDVRGYGGLIVGPGSIFNGKRYTVELATLPVPLPAHIEAMLCETKTRDRSKPDEPVQGVTVDDPRNVSCFTDWCAGTSRRTVATPKGQVAEPCIEGQGGNNRLAATGGMAHDFGLTPDKALEIALEHFNPRCEPPWDDDQFEIHFLSGYKSATGELGSRAPACDYSYLFKPVLATLDGQIVNDNIRPDSLPASTYPEPKSAAELAAGNFPRATYAWQDFILERHVNLLYGDGGTGKTLLALHIAVAIAAGLPLFDHRTVQSPALIVLAEDDDGEAKARLTAICDTLGVNLADLPITVWCLPGFDVNLACIRDDGTWEPGPFMTSLQKELGKLGPSFLILDTVSDIAALDETKRLPVNTLAKKVLTGLCRQFGATVLVNAHPSKAAMNDGTGYAGSTAWNNAVRNRLSLEREKGGNGQRRTLRVAKANYGSESELELFLFGQTFTTINKSSQSPEIERAAVLEVTLDLLDRGMCVVRSHGAGQKPKDLAQEIKQCKGLALSPQSVLLHLNTLERQGKLTYEASNKSIRGHKAGFQRPNGPA